MGFGVQHLGFGSWLHQLCKPGQTIPSLGFIVLSLELDEKMCISCLMLFLAQNRCLTHDSHWTAVLCTLPLNASVVMVKQLALELKWAKHLFGLSHISFIPYYCFYFFKVVEEVRCKE